MNADSKKPKNFHRLYHLVKQLPQYREWRDGSGRQVNNASVIIQGWIWQATNERTYKKSELSLGEYDRICMEIEEKYGLRKARHRNFTGTTKGDDRDDRARKRLLAAVHANLTLRGYAQSPEYLQNRNGYAIGQILHHAGRVYDDFNKIPYSKLLSMYHYYLKENKMLNLK